MHVGKELHATNAPQGAERPFAYLCTMTQEKKNLPRMHVGKKLHTTKCTSRCRRAFCLAFCTMTHTRSMTAHVYKCTCFVREVGSPSQMHHKVQRRFAYLCTRHRYNVPAFFFRERCFFGTRAHAEGYIVA